MEALATIVLAHVIIDLITIYDDSDDVDTSIFPILNESKTEKKVSKILERQQLGAEFVTSDTTKKVVTPQEQGSQPLEE
jgi:hypothetical protein